MHITEEERAALRAYLIGLCKILEDGARVSPKTYRRLLNEYRRVRDFMQLADLAMKANRRRPC